MAKVGDQLGQGFEHEAAAGYPRVGYGEALGLDAEVAVEQDVNVDGARPLVKEPPAAHPQLDRLEAVE